jgi:hypothetical protein
MMGVMRYRATKHYVTVQVAWSIGGFIIPTVPGWVLYAVYGQLDLACYLWGVALGWTLGSLVWTAVERRFVTRQLLDNDQAKPTALEGELADGSGCD